MPRVSVIVPAYNAARFVGRALESALGQTYVDREIIVADDGSTDETQEVVARFGARVRYLRQENRGPSAARNLALSVASGEFVAYLDADDRWYPHKLERQVAFLDAHPECGLVHSDVDVIDESDRVVGRSFNRETGRAVPRGHCLLDLLRRCHVQILTVLARGELVRRVGGFDERIVGVEDYLQWILIVMEGAEVGYLDEPLAMYRRTEGSVSSSIRRNVEVLIRMYGVLLEEKPLEERSGAEASGIVRERLFELERELAWFERQGEEYEEARRRLRRLIRGHPLRLPLYYDLLKTFVPTGPAQGLRGGDEAGPSGRPDS